MAPSTTMLPSELACPTCGGTLCTERGAAVCDRCEARYRITNGIPDFRVDQALYDGPIPREQLRSILGRDPDGSWAVTVREIIAWLDRRSHWYLDLVGSTTYPWPILLNLPNDACVLEIRCGAGGATAALARCAGHVFAMDMTLENLDLARRRLNAAGVQDKVTLVAAGDADRLPFRDGSIDYVVLVGALEYAAVASEPAGYRSERSSVHGAASMGREPEEIQMALLAEARRVLNASGGLFLAAENRYYYNYFGRLRDRVTGLKCISLLPRSVANAYSLLVRRRPYRSYSYSERAYGALLQRGGFAIQNSYVLSPDVRRIKSILPVKPLGKNARLVEPLPVRLTHYRRLLAAGFGFVARKATTSEGGHVAQGPAVGILGRLRTLHGVTYQKILSSTCPKCIIFGVTNGRKISIKVPLNVAAAARTRRNYIIINYLSKRAGCNRYVPAALGHGVEAGYRYYIEAFARGRPLRTVLTVSSCDQWLVAVAGFLDVLNPRDDIAACATSGTSLSVTAGRYWLRVNGKLTRLADKLDCHELVTHAQQWCREMLSGLTFQPGTVHGDLSVDNIMVEGGEISGVIDWDDALHCDLPLFNAYNVIDCWHQFFEPDTSAARRIRKLATWDSLSSGERAFLTSRYDRWHISPELHYGLVYLYWMQHSSDRIDGPLEYDVVKLREEYVVVLEQFVHDAGNASQIHACDSKIV